MWRRVLLTDERDVDGDSFVEMCSSASRLVPWERRRLIK